MLPLLFLFIGIVWADPAQQPVLTLFGVERHHLSFLSLFENSPTFNSVYQQPLVILVEFSELVKPDKEDIDVRFNTSEVLKVPSGSGGGHQGFTAFYANHGLRSLVTSKSFAPLYSFLRQCDSLYGLALSPSYSAFKNSFFHRPVTKEVFPDNFKVSDLFTRYTAAKPHVLYLAPQKSFEEFSFAHTKELGSFVLHQNYIEPQAESPQKPAEQQHVTHQPLPPSSGFYVPPQPSLQDVGRPVLTYSSIRPSSQVNYRYMWPEFRSAPGPYPIYSDEFQIGSDQFSC